MIPTIGGPYGYKTIGPGSSTGILVKPGPGALLLAIINASKSGQANALGIFDTSNVAAAMSGGIPIFQPILSGGQILDMTIFNGAIQFLNGVVALPGGAANADGGWVLVYL